MFVCSTDLSVLNIELDIRNKIKNTHVLNLCLFNRYLHISGYIYIGKRGIYLSL